MGNGSFVTNGGGRLMKVSGSSSSELDDKKSNVTQLSAPTQQQIYLDDEL